MNILYISQYFPPEPAAGGVRVIEFARCWAALGHHVKVLTGFPNYPDGVILPAYRRRWRRGFSRERLDGVEVLRTWLYPAPNRGVVLRSLYYASFALSAALCGCFCASRNTVVIGSSPPILVSLAAYLVARVRRLPFVFEVRDLWPESLEAVGAAQRNSLTYRIIGRLAHSLYRRADRIVVDGEWKRRALVKRGVEPGKILVFFNGVSDEFRAEVRSDSAAEEGKRLRHELALDDCFVALYFGTLGMAHALETVLEAAQRLRSHKGIAFLLVGDGAERERLIERKQALGLDNVVISYRVPRDRIPGVLAAADGFLVPLRRSEVFKTAIPSKMFEAMAAGRPVILGVEGEAREILMNARAGLAIPPEDSSSLADAILQIASNPARAARMGECGQTAVAEKYSRQKLAAEYVDHLASLIGGPICQGGCATEQQIRSLEGKADPPAIS